MKSLLGFLVPALAVGGLLNGQSPCIIDFEMLPDGTPVSDGMAIGSQFAAAFGVTFELENGGQPVLAKVGWPQTAFQGPYATYDESGCVVSSPAKEDMPGPDQGIDLGCFFLTDDGVVGTPPSPLIVRYATPVLQASGYLLDVDGTEQWRIQARDAADVEIAAIQIDPPGGDGIATPWSFSVAVPIASLRMEYTGTQPSGVGLAFDRFSPAAPSATATAYGCSVNPAGSLAVIGGALSIGGQVVLGVDNPLGTQPAGSLPFVSLALAPDPAFPCGTLLPGFGMAGSGAPGELLVDVKPPNPFLVLGGAPWVGPGTFAAVPISLPEACGLIGLAVYAQGVLVDPTFSGVTFGLTDALELVLGP